jgi:hypothetical protein
VLGAIVRAALAALTILAVPSCGGGDGDASATADDVPCGGCAAGHLCGNCGYCVPAEYEGGWYEPCDDRCDCARGTHCTSMGQCHFEEPTCEQLGGCPSEPTDEVVEAADATGPGDVEGAD